MVVFTLIFTLLVQLPAYLGIKTQDSLILKIAIMTGLGLAIAALLYFIRKLIMKNQTFSRERLNVLKIVGMTALVFLGETFLNLFWQSIGISLNESNSLDIIQQLNSANFLVMAISVVIIAPVLEELLYRGILLEKTIQYFPKYSQIAIIFSAILFAYSHTWSFSVAFLGHFITGCYFGYLYNCNRRMTDSILAHSLFNAIILFLQILFGVM